MRHVPAGLLGVVAASLLVLAPSRAIAAPPAAPSAAPAAPKTGATDPAAAQEEPKLPEMPAAVRWRARVLTPTVLSCEPVILEIGWRNTSTERVTYPDDQPLLFVVRQPGEKGLHLFWIVRRIRRDLMIPLAPGQIYTRKVPFVLGWEPGETKPPKEFVLTEPGPYEIFIVGALNTEPMAVTVAEAASAADVAARKWWTVEAARWLVGGRPDPKTVEPALETIYSHHPTSRYAPWAMWIHATIMTARGDAGDFAAAARLGEMLAARYPDFALREEVLKATVAVYAATGKADRGRQVLAELARLFPQSRYLADLRERLDKAGKRPVARPVVRSEMPSPATPIPRATVRVSGTEMIPQGAREAFQAFWRAVAGGDFAALAGLLAEEFMSDDGPRQQYLSALWKQRKNAAAGAIQVRVGKARLAEAYARPRSMPSGAARTWQGELCIVDGSLAVAWDRPGGVRDVTRRPTACWVLRKSAAGRWKLLSETSSTPNLLAAGQAQGIYSKLPRGLKTWRISDGTRERFPYEEIKAELGLTGKVADDRTRWVNHKLTMTGAAMTEPLLQGQIRLPLNSDAPTPGQWIVRDVHICLAPGPSGDLILKRIDLKMPSQPSRPGPAGLP